MIARRCLPRLPTDDHGAAITEFALILVPLMVVLGGTLELGYATYVQAIMQGALQTATRDAALGNQTPSEIDARVKATLQPLIRSPSYASCDAAPASAVPLVCTKLRSYFDFSRIGKPEKLTDDKNGNGSYDAGDCYEDANDNNSYDNAAASGRGNGGNADEVVVYTVKVAYKRLMPLDRFLGWSANNTIESTAMLRNQPFAKNVPVVTRCN